MTLRARLPTPLTLLVLANAVSLSLGAPIAGLLIAMFDLGRALWVTVASFAFAARVVARAPTPRSR
jgi:hypothetical protein